MFFLDGEGVNKNIIMYLFMFNTKHKALYVSMPTNQKGSLKAAFFIMILRYPLLCKF